MAVWICAAVAPDGDLKYRAVTRFGGVPGRVGMVGLIALRLTI